MRYFPWLKGQIAIFVVLIFQVLFVFFALALNVALVVHDKINLQNSVDLAALYGAQKQAELLNVLGHINFQMRQNYKLLAWRYRVLGSLSFDEGPYRREEYWCPFSRSGGSPKPDQIKFCDPSQWRANPSVLRQCQDSHPVSSEYCDANYFVCVSHSLWDRSDTSGSDLCKNVGGSLHPVTPFPLVSGAVPLGQSAIQAANIALADKLDVTCAGEGWYNWLTTQLFLGHFRLDQKDRKMMIHSIYNNFKSGKDLDGKSIHVGVIKVLRKNLTYINKSNFDFPEPPPEQVFSFSSITELELSEFLKPVHIYPVLEYLSPPGSNCSGSGDFKRKPHFGKPTNSDIPPDEVKEFINKWSWLFNLSLTQPLGTRDQSPLPPPNLYTAPEQYLRPLTLGYEKDPDDILYYGVSVEMEYGKAYPLFFPGLTGDTPLKLKAVAFAKPFGGRIGPSKDERDRLIKPVIIDSGSTDFTGNIYKLKPNYSRYPGDQWGLIHKDAHEKYFLNKNTNDTTLFDSLRTGPGVPYDIQYFSNLYGGDPLAYNSKPGNPGHSLFLRLMEMLATAPDLYDLTYYAPLNNYMDFYFPRICKLLNNGNKCPKGEGARAIPFNGPPGTERRKVFIRGDFGFPFSQDYSTLNKALGTHSPLSVFYANHQRTFANQHTHLDLANERLFMHKREPIPWLVKDPAHLLTSWAPVTTRERYSGYGFPQEVFAKCIRTAADPTKSIPSGCAVGGRAGYSVKLISCDQAKIFPNPPLSGFCPD